MHAFRRGLAGDDPARLRTAPVLKHSLAYNNEDGRTTTSSGLRPRVLHEYDLVPFRQAVPAGAVTGASSRGDAGDTSQASHRGMPAPLQTLVRRGSALLPAADEPRRTCCAAPGWSERNKMGQKGRPGAEVRMGGTGVAREAYSFACLSCGYGWEQAYEIERRVDVGGRGRVTYRADGVEVPSPLTRPTCRNCGEHRVRIMRAGRVAGVAAAQVRPVGHRRATSPAHVHPHHWAALHFLRRGREGA